MPFLAICPFCRRKVQAPDTAMGQSVACKKCHNYFTLAPDDDLPSDKTTAGAAHEYLIATKTSATASPVGQPAAAPAAKPSTAKTPAKPGEPQADTLQHVAMTTMPETPRLLQSMLPPPEDESASSEGINLLLLAPTILGGAALLCAAMGWLPWLTIPLAGLGILSGVIAWLTAPIESHRGALVLLGITISAAALVWALI